MQQQRKLNRVPEFGSRWLQSVAEVKNGASLKSLMSKKNKNIIGG